MKLSINHIFLSFLFLLIGNFYLPAQDANPYKLEEEGQIVHPHRSSAGILFTDNYASSLYLIYNGKAEQVLKSPNCGRGFHLSPDGSKVAFKYIDSTGKQAPAIFDLINQKVDLLYAPVTLCGQPMFWGTSGLAYSIGNTVLIYSDKNEIKIDLPNYCNQIAVSSDGSAFIWNDKNQQLFLHVIENGKDQLISPAGISCLNPQWSPDGNRIVFNAIGGQLYVFSLNENRYFEIGTGGNPVWTKDSEEIIFERAIIQDFKLITSDLFIADYKGSNVRQLTRTLDIFESQPSLDENSGLIFSNIKERKIFSAEIDFKKDELKNVQIVFEHPAPLPIRFYPIKKFAQQKSLVDLGEMPYVNQVYDTPDFHDGSGSCGPTTALMALASFNILPPWPTLINKIYPHVNDYGSYVADKYYFNGNYFGTYTNPYSSDAWGAYSYMWASGSPSSTMRDYYLLHGLVASQSWTLYCSFEDTKIEIDAGFPHSLCHYMTTAGHITLAKGYIDNQFTLLFHDPNGDKNTPGYPSYDGQNVFYDWPGYNNGYQNLDPSGTHGGIAWSVTTRKDDPVYNDTIVDDLAFGHGFYIFNEPPSHMQYFRDQTSGYNDHSWWTLTINSNQDVCYVTWKPAIADSGLYEISTFIPAINANAQQAKYFVTTDSTTFEVIIDQSAYQNKWVLLGYYNLSSTDSCTVYLGDNTGIAGEQLVFDAMRFSRAPMVGVHEISTSTEKIKVFPNPANGDFTIQVPELGTSTTIKIINIEGKIVFSDIVAQFQQSINLNTRDLNLRPGLHFIQYETGDGVYSASLSVQ
ncbi:MAG: T9SS type A sorting domain-containing protein [Bacteroidales bacterium]|nr:T9SS type A sorting domain-containing protein [Bacteroidales bacterium]MCF8455661.1 T9SS type A sorting domain-containing protein [Bacteroidales bacterium]